MINAVFIRGLLGEATYIYIYIYIREEFLGKKVYSSGTMLLEGAWLPVSRSRRPYITRVSPLRVLSTRGGGRN